MTSLEIPSLNRRAGINFMSHFETTIGPQDLGLDVLGVS